MSRLPLNRILVGDAHEHLRRLPSGAVDMVLTSPPYVGLRNYFHSEQIGAQPDVHQWIAQLQPVMAEVARVLKPTGSLWLNLGDSYSRHVSHGALAKSRLLAPERLVLTLMADGWVVRNVIAWAKPNPTPSSVKDRLTCAWEPLYLLTRSRTYYFDLDAIREPHTSAPRRQPAGRRPASRGTRPAAWAGPLAGTQSGLDRLHAAGLPGHPLGKNPGDVWTLATSHAGQGHHATFPEALVVRPILAGSPERVCTRCEQPWVRAPIARQLGHLAVLAELTPSCACHAAWRPGVVLDPFMGSGTTAVVAERLGREWLGIELNPEFAARAEERVTLARRASAGRSPPGRREVA